MITPYLQIRIRQIAEHQIMQSTFQVVLEIVRNVFINLLFGTDLFTISNSRIVPNDVTINILSAPERVKDPMDVFIESRPTEDS